MKAIIDTSSLLAFVRYYLPFDKNDKLKNLFEQKFEDGEILILDKVFEEAKFISKGIILTELKFLTDKKKHIKTVDILPQTTFFNMLENQFCNKDIMRLKGITTSEFEIEKEKYLDSADAKILLYSMSIKKERPSIVTEETSSSNDNKLFKKLPTNAKEINIDCCALPALLNDQYKLELSNYLI